MFRRLKGRTVVVTTIAGEGFRGRVVSAGWSTLRLADVGVFVSGSDVTPAEGVFRLPRKTVAWIQELS